ncbi:MAG: HAD family phosphatase [Prevotella sp.]|uniref:HAD family hydrolase n=1 Tax=Prevotella sp. TaxID=59823 RepID=UPI002A28CBFD|nr:HAD family phosphatase [Prevotella sp.]MDD7317211.1 HAD family phosphatase [Prevotellaceae bacterium]MDY4019815.1 HAD family phosphatase [Prevotella sp.]
MAKDREIRNIVFDFGGVLVGLDKRRCIAALDSIGAWEISGYVDECRQEDLFHDLEIGSIGVAEFCNEVRRKSPRCHASDEKIAWAWGELLTGIPQEKLLRIAELRKDHRIFLLSNTNVIHWELSVEKYFRCGELGVGDFFERIFLSYEMGMVKPGREIFLTMLAEAGIDAGETLFIDDSAANCEAAESVGINTMHDPEGWLWMKKL